MKICIGKREKKYIEGKLVKVDNVFRSSKSMRVMSQIYKLSRGYVEKEGPLQSGDSPLDVDFPVNLPKSLIRLNNSTCV